MRGKQAPKRELTPDSRYQSVLITKFINTLMRKGKKSTAQNILYGCFDHIGEVTKLNPLDVFDEALKNITPVLEVRGRRIGGSNYQIPMPVRPARRQALAFRWLILGAQSRKGKSMKERLALEIMDAKNNIGASIKKKEDVHRMAEANKAFAHFARFAK